MVDLDTMWCREFVQMMNQRKAQNPDFNINEIPLPEGVCMEPEAFDKVLIRGISEEYYSKLNNTEARIWNGGALYRRKYDYKGEYIRNKDGNYETTHVPVPNDCIAVMSDVKIGVPNKFKSDEPFEYVDALTRTKDDGTLDFHTFVYIIPRKYCYKLSQTALVIGIDKLRNYYEGVSVATVQGYYLNIYIIPYKPTRKVYTRYRVLTTKTSIDYRVEIQAIMNYWLNSGFIFNPSFCETESGYKGRENMAVEHFPIVLEEYIRYDENKSMSIHEDDMDTMFDELVE